MSTEIPPLSPPPPIQRVGVIVPTYNESESIVSLLKKILEADPRLEILMVDDASPDGTADLAAKNFSQKVEVIRRPGKLGYASACREGFQRALAKNYDAVVTMDADGSHDPKDISHLLKRIELGADVAAGSRYLDGVRVLNWPLRRLFLSAGAGIYVRTLTRLPMTDPTSGFKALRRQVVERLKWNWDHSTTEGYCLNIETYYYAWKAGFRIVEVPIIFTERRLGASKMTSKIALEAAWHVFSLALKRFS